MGFLWVTGFSFFHCVASPFHSFVTTNRCTRTFQCSVYGERGTHATGDRWHSKPCAEREPAEEAHCAFTQDLMLSLGTVRASNAQVNVGSRPRARTCPPVRPLDADVHSTALLDTTPSRTRHVNGTQSSTWRRPNAAQAISAGDREWLAACGLDIC